MDFLNRQNQKGQHASKQTTVCCLKFINTVGQIGQTWPFLQNIASRFELIVFKQYGNIVII